MTTAASPSGPGPDERRRAAVYALVAALGALAPALALDVAYFRNGISVEWRTEHEGETRVVASTTEHDIRFPNDHRALARYVQHWRVAEHGLPRSIPRLDARVRARIHVTTEGGRHLSVRSRDDVSMSIDGLPATEETLVSPGWHALEVLWSGPLRSSSSFELVWRGDDPIERSALLPIGGEWPETRRSFWGWALLLVLVAAALGARAGLGRTDGDRRMRLLALATLAVVVWGTGLRAWDYTVEPEFRDNYDEYFGMWNGWSLLEDGTSRGWSAWPGAYTGDAVEMEHYAWWGVPLAVATPYFENLPLAHLLAGAACQLGGTTDYRDCHHADGRLVSIALSALAILLIVAIGRRLVPSGPGPWLAALLWASIPALVLQTRVVKEELLVVVLALGSGWFFLRWRDDGRKRSDLAVASVLSGLAVMAKLPALFFVPALVMLVASTRDHRAAMQSAAIATLAGLGTMLPFIAWQGWDGFVQASGAQLGGRGVHFLIFPRFFDLLLINGLPFGRGWALFLWIAGLGGLYTWPPERRSIVIVPMALYLVAIAFGTGNNTFGWYGLPIFCFLVIPAGAFLGELWRAPDLMRGVLFGVLFVMYSVHFLFEPSLFGHAAESAFVRRIVGLTVVGLVAPYCLVQVWPRFTAFARLTFALSLAVALYANASLVVGWESRGPVFRDIERVWFP